MEEATGSFLTEVYMGGESGEKTRGVVVETLPNQNALSFQVRRGTVAPQRYTKQVNSVRWYTYLQYAKLNQIYEYTLHIHNLL